jgi:hypothetical protein
LPSGYTTQIPKEYDMNLIPGTRELVQAVLDLLKTGESLGNQKLNRIAEECFGGARARGVHTPRDSYDALETAVNQFLLEEMASRSALPVSETLKELRDLLGRLPEQTSRTTAEPE